MNHDQPDLRDRTAIARPFKLGGPGPGYGGMGGDHWLFSHAARQDLICSAASQRRALWGNGFAELRTLARKCAALPLTCRPNA